MGIDQLKVAYTYSIATIIVVGGFLFLFFSRNDPPTGQSASMVPLVAGFIGAAITFVFQRETATNSARQTERAYAASTAATVAATAAAATPPPAPVAPIPVDPTT